MHNRGRVLEIPSWTILISGGARGKFKKLSEQGFNSGIKPSHKPQLAYGANNWGGANFWNPEG